MKKVFRRVVSFLICSSMLFVFNCNVFAEGNSTDSVSTQITNQYFIEQLDKISVDIFNEYPGYEKAINKVKGMLKDGYTQEQIRDTFTKSEMEILKGIGLQQNNETKTVLQSTNANLNEVDILAQEYYDYYQTYRDFPSTIENTIASSEVYATAAYNSVLSGMGYYFTSEQLALQLAELGVASQLDGPLPYMDLLCILAGAVMLTATAYNYYLYGDAINSKIIGWYGSAATSYANSAYASTADYVWYRYWANVKYWQAMRVSYRYLGGVALVAPVTDATALAILKSGQDTFTYFNGEAASLADKASIGNPRHNDAHVESGLIFNLPHWHAMISGVQQKGHSFYTF